MKVRITRLGTRDLVEPVGPSDSVSELKGWADRRFSFRTKGAEYSSAFQSGQWDGRIRLVTRRGAKLLAPAGLTDEVLGFCAERGWDVEVDDRRPPDWTLAHLEWKGPELRPYQKDAVAAALKAEGGILKLPVRAGKCILGDMEIYDPTSGMRRRADAGDLVSAVAMTTDGKLLARGARSSASGTKPCALLRTTSGLEVGLSLDHPVFTNEGWVEAGKLEPGVHLVATPRRLPEPACPTLVSEAEVKFVAYMLADGNTANGACSFDDSNEVVLLDFESAVVALGGEFSRRAARGCVHVNVRGLRPLLRRHGIAGCRSGDKRVPASFYGLSREMVVLFLRCFWACDGHVANERRVAELTLASKGLIDDVRFLLLRLGIVGRTRYKEASYTKDGTRHVFGAWRLTISGSRNIGPFSRLVGSFAGREKRCSEILDEIEHIADQSNVDVIPLTKERADEVWAHLVATGKKRRYGDKTRTLERMLTNSKGDGRSQGRVGFERLVAETEYGGPWAWLATSDLFWDAVASVSFVGERSVWDVEVPEGGNFVGGGVVLHNTVIAARIVHELDVRTLFVVTSKTLMRQAADVFRSCLSDVVVGCFGDDVDERKADVVVATIQTIAARGVEETLAGMRGPSWAAFPASLDHDRWKRESPVSLLFGDEVHHHASTVGKAWREAMLEIPARRKYGLSATVHVDRRMPSETADVWTWGIFGPPAFELEATDLIRMGHLLSPIVRFVEHGAREIRTSGWSADVYTRAIVECEERNDAIVREVVDRVRRGKTVLVDTSRRAHARLLHDRLRDALGPGKVLLALGGCSDDVRKRMLKLGPGSEERVVVGTILGEGVDVPGLEVVVNAEGGKGFDPETGKNVTAFDQRMRSLTKILGKEDAEVIELVDVHERHLRKWTISRLNGYAKHPGFRIVVPEEEGRT